jgi:hypothetical protein
VTQRNRNQINQDKVDELALEAIAQIEAGGSFNFAQVDPELADGVRAQLAEHFIGGGKERLDAIRAELADPAYIASIRAKSNDPVEQARISGAVADIINRAGKSH